MNITLFKKKTARSISFKHFFDKNTKDSSVKKTSLITLDTVIDPLSDQELLDTIKSAKEELDFALEKFEFAVDSDIIDGCIYKIKSCTEYYQHLLKIAKQRGISCSYIPYVLKENQKGGLRKILS